MVYMESDWDLWVYDRERKVSTRLTFTPGIDGPGVFVLNWFTELQRLLPSKN